MILSSCLALSFLVANALQSKSASIVSSDPQTVEQQIISREREFSELVMGRDAEGAREIQAKGYRLLVRMEGSKLVELPQEVWLETLKKYIVRSYRIDDIKVLDLGDVAIATVAYYQDAHIQDNPRNITGDFMLTDVWVKRDGKWKIIERHSSRAEAAPPK